MPTDIFGNELSGKTIADIQPTTTGEEDRGFVSGVTAGLAGTAGGLADFADALTGYGRGAGDYFDGVVRDNARTKQYTWSDMIPGVSDYWTNSQGAAYGIGQTIGSSLPLLLAGGGIGALGRAGFKAMGAEGIASALGKNAATKLMTAEAIKAVPEAMSEGGNLYRDKTTADAYGNFSSTDLEAQDAAVEGALKNIPVLMAGNILEGALLGGAKVPFLSPKINPGDGVVKRMAKTALPPMGINALQEGTTEFIQEGISGNLKGETVFDIMDSSTWGNPASEEQKMAAAEGALGGAVLSGAPAAYRGARHTAQETVAPESPAATEAPDVLSSIQSNFEAGKDEALGENGCTAAVKKLLPNDSFVQGANLWVPDWVEKAKKEGVWADASEGGRPGDIAVIETNSNPGDGADHVVVVGADGKYYGNSSSKGHMVEGDLAADYGAGNIVGYIRTGGEGVSSSSTFAAENTNDAAARAYLENLVNSDDPNIDEAFAALDGQADIFETATKLGYKAGVEEPQPQMSIGADEVAVQEQQQPTEPSSYDDFTAAESLNDFTANEMAGVVPGRKGVVDALGALLGKRSEALAEEIADAREHTPAARQKLVDVLNQAKNQRETQQLFTRAKEKFNRTQADIKALDIDTLLRLAYNVSDKPMTNEVKQQIGRELAERGILPPAISQGVNFDKEMLDIARKRKTSTHRFTDPQTQARLNALTGEKPGEIVVPERGSTIREALTQPFAEPIQGPSGALMSAEDKVMENAYRSAVNRGEYEKAAQIAQQSGKQGMADILRNVMPEKGVRERMPVKRYGTELIANMKANNIPFRYDLREALLGDDPVAIRAAERKLHEAGINADKIKFSFSDRHARDRERMRQQEKQAGNFVPEGYKGESTGVREGLSALEIRNIEAFLQREMGKGKSEEVVVKELQLIYNKVKVNKSDGMSEAQKLASMKFIKGAIGYVREKGIHDGRLSEFGGINNERADERSDGRTLQEIGGPRGNARGFSGLPESESNVKLKETDEGKSYGQTLLDLAKQSGVKADYNMLERHIEHGVKRATDFLEKKLAEQGVDIDQIKAQQAGHSEKGAFFAPENKPKFSFSDRHARDRKRMRQQEKQAGSFIPEGYEGRASGVVEGLASREVESIKSYIHSKLSEGKTLEYVEKELKTLYNRIKANRSGEFEEKRKIAFLRFVKGAMVYVNERKGSDSGGISRLAGQDHRSAEQGRYGSSFQEHDRGGNDRRGLRGTDSAIEQDEHSEKGAFFAPENKPKYSSTLEANEVEAGQPKGVSLSDRDVEEMVQRSIGQQIKVIPENVKLSPKLQRIAEFGESMGCKVRYYDGPAQVRGFHADGVTYINRRSELPHMWVFWHESFHWLRNNNPSLYRDMLEYLKGKDGFSQKQISAYREEIGRPELSDDAVIEEMLADYMPDAARRVGLMKALAKDNTSLAERFVAWLQDMMDRFHEFFKTPAAGLTKEQKHNAVWGFTNLARDMVDGDRKPIFKVTGIGKIGLRRNGEPVGSVLRGETSVAYSTERGKPKSKEEIEANIRRGTAAMEKVIAGHVDVENAMYRDDVGSISFYWGEPGRGNKFKKGRGISHIIAKRDFESGNGVRTARKMVEVLAKGDVIERQEANLGSRVLVEYDDHTAVLSLYKDGNRNTWLLTGWENKKETSNATGEVYDSSRATATTPTLSRRDGEEVSFINHSIPQKQETVQESRKKPKFSLRKDGEQPVTREEIHAAINKLVTARTGKIKQKDVLGRFDARQNVVRTKFYGDFPTAAHEVGHYIDSQLQIKGHTLELVQYARKRFPNGEYKASELRAEGIAEFGRLILTKPTLAEKEFPGYFKAYQKAIEEHPELGKPLDEIGRKMRQWYAQSPEARGSGSVVSAKDKGFKERVKEALDDLYVNWVDKLDPLRKMNAEIERVLEKKMGYQENIYERARMAESFARGRAQMLVTEENPKLAIDALNKAAKTKLRHKVTLCSIFDSIAEEKMNKLYPDYLKRGNFENWHKAFSVYLVARRQMELQRQLPKYNGPLSREDAAAIYKNAPRELAEAAYDYYRYNDNLLTIAEDAGLISKELHAVLNEKYANYAPMLRDFSDEEAVDSFFGGMGGKGIGNVSSFLKKISEDGSDRNVLDPLEVTVKNTFVVLDRAERNKVAQLFVDLSKENALGKFAEELPGVKASEPKRSIFTVMVNGEKKAYQTLPEFYGAIAGSNQLSANVVANLFRTTAQMLRTGATISPDFILRNLFRDAIFAGISSKTGFIPIVDTIRGMRALKQNAELAAEFRAAGVPMSNFVGTNRRGASQTLDEMAGTSSWRKLTPLKVLHSLYEYAQDASELVESSSRMGEFMRARQQGKSIEEAGYLAKELTLDFGRSGIWGQKANQAIPFFNVCIQGGDKMYRLLRDQPKPTLFALAKYIMLPSVLLWALNHDEDWYKELPEDVKNGSWVWKAGDTIYRLPKPQEAGVLFGSSLERLLDQINGENPKAVKEWSKYMKETVLPSATPALITPIFEWMTNYSFFREKPIVGRREENLPDALQYNAYTSELAKRLGGALNLSPMKIDNTIRGYFGTAGAFVAQSMDRFFGKEHEMPEKRWSELAGIRGFTHTEYGRAKSVEEFYRIHDAIMKEHNAHGVKGHPAGYVQGARLAARQISAAQKDIRSITVNPKLSPAEKRRQIDLRQKRILDVAKRANKALEKYVTE